LDQTIWSLASLRLKRISGSKNFHSPVRKDFCNNIGTKQTWREARLMSVFGVERQSDFGANRSVDDPERKSAGRSFFRPSTLCQTTDFPFGGSDASRVDIWVRGHVLDLAMRYAYILQVAAIQAVQGGSHLLAFASFLKRVPASPDEASDLPVRNGRLSQYC
jgi:hypothetical protein